MYLAMSGLSCSMQDPLSVMWVLSLWKGESHGTWDLSSAGIESASHTLQSRFLTTRPSGRSQANETLEDFHLKVCSQENGVQNRRGTCPGSPADVCKSVLQSAWLPSTKQNVVATCISLFFSLLWIKSLVWLSGI